MTLQVPVFQITDNSAEKMTEEMISLRLPRSYKERYKSINYVSKRLKNGQSFADFCRELLMAAIDAADVPTGTDDE